MKKTVLFLGTPASGKTFKTMELIQSMGLSKHEWKWLTYRSFIEELPSFKEEIKCVFVDALTIKDLKLILKSIHDFNFSIILNSQCSLSQIPKKLLTNVEFTICNRD